MIAVAISGVREDYYELYKPFSGVLHLAIGRGLPLVDGADGRGVAGHPGGGGVAASHGGVIGSARPATAGRLAAWGEGLGRAAAGHWPGTESLARGLSPGGLPPAPRRLHEDKAGLASDLHAAVCLPFLICKRPGSQYIFHLLGFYILQEQRLQFVDTF